MKDHKVKSSSSEENRIHDPSSDIKVSIIIPVYNVERYLKQCLDSVLNQTLKEIEVICVNDGSSDNSQLILEEYAKKDNRIRILTQENMGSGVARNRAIEYAEGEYMGFMDSDDWAEPTMFEKLYKNAKLNDCDIVMCPMLIVNESKEELSSAELKNLSYYNLDCFDDTFNNRVFNYRDTKDFILKIAVNVYNKIYKTSLVKECNAKFAEGLLFQDNTFTYHTYLNASRVSLIREFLYFHRTRRPGSVQTEKGKGYYDIIKIQNMIIEIFKSLPDYDEIEIELLNKKLIQIIVRYLQVAEKYRPEFFRLIKQDFEKMNLKNDLLDSLHPAAKANYLNIINSDSYKEFELRKERNNLLNRIYQLNVKNKKLVKANNQLTRKTNKMAEHLTAYGYIKYKSKNIADRLINNIRS